jgi:hypothetical protein
LNPQTWVPFKKLALLAVGKVTIKADAVDASAYLKTLSSFCKFPTFLAIREVQTRERTKAPRMGGNQWRTTYANRGPVERPVRLFGQWKNRMLLTTADRRQGLWP